MKYVCRVGELQNMFTSKNEFAIRIKLYGNERRMSFSLQNVIAINQIRIFLTNDWTAIMKEVVKILDWWADN